MNRGAGRQGLCCRPRRLTTSSLFTIAALLAYNTIQRTLHPNPPRNSLTQPNNPSVDERVGDDDASTGKFVSREASGVGDIFADAEGGIGGRTYLREDDLETTMSERREMPRIDIGLDEPVMGPPREPTISEDSRNDNAHVHGLSGGSTGQEIQHTIDEADATDMQQGGREQFGGSPPLQEEEEEKGGTHDGTQENIGNMIKVGVATESDDDEMSVIIEERERRDEEDSGEGTTPAPGDVEIETGRVTVKERNNNMDQREYDLDYYRCGPRYTPGIGIPDEQSGGDNGDVAEVKILQEILLLHGAKYSKEDWFTSGIMKYLCRENADNPRLSLSVTAVDLDVASDGFQVFSAFESLAEGGVVSGMPLIVVSPSASGKGIVNLAEIADASGLTVQDAPTPGEDLLKRIAMGWVPVAAPAVMQTKDTTLNEFRIAQIPVLAVYGSEDAMGKTAADRLRDSASARTMQLGRQHACYLDSPDAFAQTLRSFADDIGKGT